MKNSILFLLKTLLTVFVFMASIIVTGAIVTPLFGLDLSFMEMPDNNLVMKGLFTYGIIQSLVLIMIAGRSAVKGIKLAFLLAAVFFSLNHLLNVIESLVFMRNIYPVAVQLVETLNGLLTALILGFTVAFLFGSRKESDEVLPNFNWSAKLILPWIGWTVIWFVIYFSAGVLIPLSVEGFTEFYFGENGAMDMSLVPIGYLMQIPRGAIWILLAIYLSKYLKGSHFEKSLVIGITFGVLMSSSLLIPNFLMPDIIRLAHLPEIMFANLLWGLIISWNVKRHFTGVEQLD